MWALLIIAASGAQNIGLYDDLGQCQRSAEDLIKQGIKAVCVKQEDPTVVMSKMLKAMNLVIADFNKELNK